MWLLTQASRGRWNSAPRLLLSFYMKCNTLQPTKQTFTHRSKPEPTVKVKMRCMLGSRAGSRWCCSLKHLLAAATVSDSFSVLIRLSFDKKKKPEVLSRKLSFILFITEYSIILADAEISCAVPCSRGHICVNTTPSMARFVCNNWTVPGRLVSYRRGHQRTIRFMRKT